MNFFRQCVCRGKKLQPPGKKLLFQTKLGANWGKVNEKAWILFAGKIHPKMRFGGKKGEDTSVGKAITFFGEQARKGRRSERPWGTRASGAGCREEWS